MSQDDTIEYKVIADQIVSPDDDIVVLINGAVYMNEVAEENRLVTVSDLPEGGNADTGDITFDGVKIIGAGEDSGDGYGNATMELVPDADLYANDQYLVVDPTAPSHIHLRAGGTQDESNAELYLGGERTHIRIVDNSGLARMQGSYTYSNTYYPGDWTSAVVTEDGSNRTLEITDPAQYILDFLASSDWNNASQVFIGFDGGERGFIYGQNSTESTLTFFLELTGTPSGPTAIASLELYYEQRSRVEIDMNDDQELSIVGNGIDVNIFSSGDISINASDNVNIESGNNIAIDAEDNIVLYSAEGGHFLQSGEDPNNQIATIGDLPAAGASGSFTTVDGKSVTVTNGIITDISAI